MKKGLKIKDISDFQNLCLKRGVTAELRPIPDADGDFIIDFDNLVSGDWKDLAEDILDLCEVKEYTPLDELFENKEDQPVQPEKGEFKGFVEEYKDVELAVEAYYESKKGFFTKMLESVVNFFQ